MIQISENKAHLFITVEENAKLNSYLGEIMTNYVLRSNLLMFLNIIRIMRTKMFSKIFIKTLVSVCKSMLTLAH